MAAAILYRPGSVKQMLADTPDRVSSDDGVRAAVLNDDHVKTSVGKSTGETLQGTTSISNRCLLPYLEADKWMIDECISSHSTSTGT